MVSAADVPNPQEIVGVDLDGDGNMDVVYFEDSVNGKLAWVAGGDTSSFGAEQIIEEGADVDYTKDIAVADVDG